MSKRPEEDVWTEARLRAWNDRDDRGLCVCALDGRVIWSNGALARTLGTEPTRLGDLAIGPGARDQLEQWAKELTEADGLITGVFRGANPGAACSAVRIVLARVGEPDAAIVAAVTDISEYDGLARELAARERSQSFLKAATSDLLLRLDTEWRVLWQNEAAGHLFSVGAKLGAMVDSPSMESLQRWVDTCSRNSSTGETKAECVLRSAPDAAMRWQLRGVGRILTDEAGAYQGTTLILRDESDSGRVQQFSRDIGLSPREEEVLQYLVTGYSNLNIAMILGLSESGVKFHVKNIMGKAKVGSRTELLAQLFRL